MTPVDRRTALALMGAGVLAARLEAAQQHLHALAAKPNEYKLQFFTADENDLLDRVAEMILPADGHSPGAHESKVSYYVDLVAANSAETTKVEWRSRLQAFDRLRGKPFLQLNPSEQAQALNAAAAGEQNPSSPAEWFFADVKKMTLFAYYTSPIGLLQELGYKGNQALAAFPGCLHPPGTHS